jgi:membrane-associated protein
MTEFIDFFLHLDRSLGTIIQRYDTWTYVLLFLVIFCETGLVVMPLLPGDSLLFAAGAFAATGALHLGGLFVLISVAAILGDSVNYAIGRRIGPRIFQMETGRLLNKKHLLHAQTFYERHGGKTILIARFVPIVRTFAPFVAGVGRMNYGRFSSYYVAGGFFWAFVCLLAGYFFSNMPVVKENFSLVILLIIFISVLPGLIEILRHRKKTS